MEIESLKLGLDISNDPNWVDYIGVVSGLIGAFGGTYLAFALGAWKETNKKSNAEQHRIKIILEMIKSTKEDLNNQIDHYCQLQEKVKNLNTRNYSVGGSIFTCINLIKEYKVDDIVAAFKIIGIKLKDYVLLLRYLDAIKVNNDSKILGDSLEVYKNNKVVFREKMNELLEFESDLIIDKGKEIKKEKGNIYEYLQVIIDKDGKVLDYGDGFRISFQELVELYNMRNDRLESMAIDETVTKNIRDKTEKFPSEFKRIRKFKSQLNQIYATTMDSQGFVLKNLEKIVKEFKRYKEVLLKYEFTQ